ncbi:MAG: 4Fe-4S binding protein [Bacteroidales bacterium]|nr:4Fe-4S binding protein [Bacteroidales bacterium]
MKNIEKIQLEEIKEKYSSQSKKIFKQIIVCAGTGCISNGSMLVYEALKKHLKNNNLNYIVDLKLDYHDCEKNVKIIGSGCQGYCAQGPLVTILPSNIMYVKVKKKDAEEIITKSILNDEIITRLLYKNKSTNKKCKNQNEIPFYTQQQRIVLDKCGIIDPENIFEYISFDGYFAAEKAFSQMSDSEICSTILESGLRGRGGGGFLTGQKWEITRNVESEKKYIICNGDEGDPGAFMDRSVMEGNPHKVIEGIMIASKAINADEAFIYVRAEYPLAVKRIKKAINDATNLGILGDNIFGTGKSLKISVMEGAGAFVCGEETALISSIEGKRGMPTRKPPYPAEKGLLGKSTVINNVETLATIPTIISNGANWYSSIGNKDSKGTKTFALTGHIVNTGLIEVPLGTTLRKIIYDIGGGVLDKNGKTGGNLKAIQIGGPSGGCIPAYLIDTPIDFENISKTGAIIGSGGLVVMNETTCMVDMARFFIEFTQKESCGKCTFCRIGTKRMLEILTRLTEGNGRNGDIELLEELCEQVTANSLCGLGQTAPNPVLTTLKYFRNEYEAHIYEKKCPAHSCKNLVKYSIISKNCVGCTACAKICPVNAISGERKKAHSIDQNLCIKCGQCYNKCKFNAIEIF